MRYNVSLKDVNGRPVEVSFDISEEEVSKMADSLKEEDIREYMAENSITYEESRRKLAEYHIYMLKLVGHE